jgi:drug/metabolite transporter (DMT)-like permease
VQREPAVASPRRFGISAVVVATVAWSAAAVLVKASDLSGLRFGMYRLWTGVAIYAVVLLVTRRRLTWRTFRTCAPGGVIFGVDISLAFVAFKLTSVADATIIAALSPVVIALVSARLLAEPVGVRERLLAGLSFVGVAIVAVGSSGSPIWSALGDLAAFVGVATWTAYWFFSRRARDSAPAIEYMASVMVAAALVVTPAALLFGRGPLTPDASDWVAIAAVAFIPGFIGHTLVAWSHRHVASWRSALITQCHPVLASLSAWVFLGESLTALVIAGTAIVVASTGLVILGQTRRPLIGEELDEAAEKAT